jgi:squalene-hopene/tetraprenyl-beta-curcumene cyclase
MPEMTHISETVARSGFQRPSSGVTLTDQIANTLRASTAWLLRCQRPEGFWVGMVESNSCIEAEWLLAAHILGTSLPFASGAIRTLFDRQRQDGSWDVYPGAPAGDINSTVEVYAALRATGHSQDLPELRRARDWIRAHDGLRNVRVFTRYWLAMLGIWPWRYTPNLPPEIIRLPLWMPFNIYHFAQWARATLVPLSVLSARRPVWPLPGGSRLDELFPQGLERFDFTVPAKQARLFSVEKLFLGIDTLLHGAQTLGAVPGRETSIRLCLEWMIRHQDADGAWGGIQPPWIYGLIALRNEGYALSHPVLERGLAALSAHSSYERNGSRHIQATDSAVWDTLLSVLALSEIGHRVPTTPAMARALRWLLDHQVLIRGDWSVKAPTLPPGGWSFERANAFYPDVDDTALALLVLARIRQNCGAGSLRREVDQAIERAVGWVLGMQSGNGGWAAFDRDNTKRVISAIPFCNFGEALDPPSADVTAHVLEALGSLGYTAEHPAIRRALEFIYSEQESDGSWFGRWGVNHIYGTGAVLPALRALGQNTDTPRIRSAVEWLLARQNPDGGWGESCASYMVKAARGRGESTPSQTAWALLALIAAGRADTVQAIAAGVSFLTATCRPDGTWDEQAYTGTGFPGYGAGARVDLDDPELCEKLQQGPELSRGFMIGYNMYRHYFPMLALARARECFGS